jgi:gliding motility-associated-like protein
LVSSCGENEIEFENESYQERFVEDVRWEFDINNQTIVQTDWNAKVAFPENGQYEGVLYLNPGTICADTANIFVNIFPEINVDFDQVYDTCEVGPVVFSDSSSTNAEKIVSWNWDFGDGNSSALQNPQHTYTTAGMHPVSLTVMDNNRCAATKQIALGYYPAPPFLLIEPTTFDGCAPANIFFNNASIPINDEYDILWEFGDGMTSTAVSPSHLYADPGVYDVSIDVTSPFGCRIAQTYPNYIRVRASPTADFSFEPSRVSILNPTVQFTDESTDASKWEYNFNNMGRSLLPNPVFTFRDTGLQAVQLVVSHLEGCTDTIVQFIDVFPEVRFFMPNAFTPNEDGVNDVFKGKGILIGARDYHFSIWNRWGELLFETTDTKAGWNGRKNNVGEVSPNGVYIYVVTYTTPRGEPVRLEGFATIVK